MNERDTYPNLPADVSIHHCTKDHPMDINGEDAVKLKQLWTHEDAEETEASIKMDGNIIWLNCPNCKYSYSVWVGD